MRIIKSQSLKVRMTLLLKYERLAYVVQTRHDTKKWGHTLKVCHLCHEFSGVVDAIGSDVTHVNVGDKVKRSPSNTLLSMRVLFERLNTTM